MQDNMQYGVRACTQLSRSIVDRGRVGCCWMLVDVTYVIIDLLRLEIWTPIYLAQLRTDFHWA
jgi:hypothetical protein